MRTKENKKINILISGEENNKSEIVYNNVIQNMNLTSEEQLKYLKTKVSYLELELKNRNFLFLLFMISLIGIGLGLYFLIRDFYLLGSIFIIVTFVGVSYKFYGVHKNITTNKDSEFDKIEHLRKILNDRIK